MSRWVVLSHASGSVQRCASRPAFVVHPPRNSLPRVHRAKVHRAPGTPRHVAAVPQAPAASELRRPKLS